MAKLQKLGNNIKYYREKNGWTQDDVGNRINVSRSNISKWESGESTPAVIDLIELSRLFHTSLDQLVGESNIPHEMLLEYNRKYYSTILEDDTNILDVIDYLVQNPQLTDLLKRLSTMKPSERKKYESIFIHIVQTLTDSQ